MAPDVIQDVVDNLGNSLRRHAHHLLRLQVRLPSDSALRYDLARTLSEQSLWEIETEATRIIQHFLAGGSETGLDAMLDAYSWDHALLSTLKRFQSAKQRRSKGQIHLPSDLLQGSSQLIDIRTQFMKRSRELAQRPSRWDAACVDLLGWIVDEGLQQAPTTGTVNGVDPHAQLLQLYAYALKHARSGSYVLDRAYARVIARRDGEFAMRAPSASQAAAELEAVQREAEVEIDAVRNELRQQLGQTLRWIGWVRPSDDRTMAVQIVDDPHSGPIFVILAGSDGNPAPTQVGRVIKGQVQLDSDVALQVGRPVFCTLRSAPPTAAR